MLVILSGLTLFLAGIRLTSDHLQGAFGTHLRRYLAQFSRNIGWAALTGSVLTALTQSATLVTVLTVKFTNSGILTFNKGLAVMLGAGIGGTLLVQILSLHIPLLYPLLALSLLLRSRRLVGGHLGGVFLGLGLLLLGQDLLLGAVAPLEQDRLVQQLLQVMSSQPSLLFAAGLLLAVLIQSSNAVAIMVLSLSTAQLLSLESALFIIVGANVGSPITTLLTTWSGELAGRRVALSHVVLKFVAAALLLPFAPRLVDGLQNLGAEPGRVLANAHTLFNVVALVYLPFGIWTERLFYRVMPEQKRPDGPRYLDLDALSTPHMAYGLAFRETLRVAENVLDLYHLAGQALSGKDVKFDVLAREEKIDHLVQEIISYTVLMSGHVPQEQLSALIDMISELEALADLCKRLARQPNKLTAGGQTLHPDSLTGLQHLMVTLGQQFKEAVTFLGMRQTPFAAELFPAVTPEDPGKWQAYRLAHLMRLASHQETQLSIAMLMDVLAILEQIEAGFNRLGSRLPVLTAVGSSGGSD